LTQNKGPEFTVAASDERRLGLVSNQFAQRRTNLAADARDYSWPAVDVTTFGRKCL